MNKTDRRYSTASSVPSLKRNTSSNARLTPSEPRRSSFNTLLKRPLKKIKQANKSGEDSFDGECDKMSGDSQSGDSVPEEACMMILETTEESRDEGKSQFMVCCHDDFLECL